MIACLTLIENAKMIRLSRIDWQRLPQGHLKMQIPLRRSGIVYVLQTFEELIPFPVRPLVFRLESVVETKFWLAKELWTIFSKLCWHFQVVFSLEGREKPAASTCEYNGHAPLNEQQQSQNQPNGVTRRFGGLSLKESVRENVPKKTNKAQQHSPPPVTAFANKKDSGYTSSR